MKFVSYLGSVPANNKKEEKTDILNYFVQGVSRSTDHGVLHRENNLIDCDVALIQGWVHEKSKTSPHLKLRKAVIDYQKAQGKKVLVADSNLFLYANKENPHHYLRYSFNDVFPITGEYFWNNPNPDHWKKISCDLNIVLKDWKTNSKNILICTQRNGGWSMKGFDVVAWLEQTVTTVRKYTDRPIIVRPHPGDKNAVQYLNSKDPRWTISSAENITDDFASAWAVITFNSSPGVAAAIEGIPVFVTDPTPQISQAYDVANTDLSLIETPKTFDRQAWIEKISMSHWSFADLKTGKAWEHIRKYV
jgi:hypothetical protein